MSANKEEPKYAVYINGKVYSKENARISVFDHGFLYGDGAFEGVRIYDGKIFRLNNHLERFFDSIKALNISPPMPKEKMRQVIIETIKEAGFRDGQVRPIITRGSGLLGLDPRNCKEGPTFIVIAYGYSTPFAGGKEGIKAITSTVRRIPPECLDQRIKSLNYLNSIMAKNEAIAAGADEAIMLDISGYIAEGTGDNLFMVKNGKILSPALTSALGGITRQTVIEVAEREEYKVEIGTFTLYNLYTADEIFLTGTNIEIIPVIEIDGRIINNRKVGEITHHLKKAYSEFVRSEAESIL
jgi:branched-chain amino acid aminotransferase